MAPHWSFLVKFIGIAPLFALVFFALSSFSHAENPTGLSIAFISENQVIVEGTPFTVGFHIQHEERYHTYWQNPGIVGMPTSLDWTLPEGFTASEIQWPYPERTFMAIHPCYGYERDIILLVTITPPKVLSTSEITLNTSASWMCCAESCHPGFQDLSLTLPVGKEIKLHQKESALISAARKELPKPPEGFQVVLKSKIDEKIIQLLILSQIAKDTEAPYFFSSDGQISSNKKQTIKRHPNGSLSITATRSEFSPKGKKTLPGVLQLGSNHILLDLPYSSK